jgi:hypothetical protein
MEVEWYKCQGNIWCELNKVDIYHKFLDGLSGIYIIWYGGKEDRTVLRIGLGNIRQELESNKNDIAIQAFSKYNLQVSWAEVPLLKKKNILVWLNQKLNPKFKDNLPSAKPVETNLPW